jgi:hypothetical protein
MQGIESTMDTFLGLMVRPNQTVQKIAGFIFLIDNLNYI